MIYTVTYINEKNHRVFKKFKSKNGALKFAEGKNVISILGNNDDYSQEDIVYFKGFKEG